MNQKDAKKLIEKIKPEWRQYFIASERVSAGKPVLLVETEKFAEFLAALKDKVMIGLLISGALRISECLKIQRNHFDIDREGNVFVTTTVMKKRREGVTREIIVHPAIVSVVKEHLLTKRGFGKLFFQSRIASVKRIKRIFGDVLDCHAFRHASISRQIFGLGFSIEKVAKLQKMSPRIVEAYTHLNERQTLKELYSGKKVA
jgi:integrase